MSLRQLLSRHTRVPIVLSSRTYIGLPDEVQMLKDMTRTFAEQELAPIASKIDKEPIHTPILWLVVLRTLPLFFSDRNEPNKRSIYILPNKLLKCLKWV